MTEDIEAWYINFDLRGAGLRPVPARACTSSDETQTVAQPLKDMETAARSRRGYARVQGDRARAALQTTSRLAARVRRRRRHGLSEGHGGPAARRLRPLDNPFFWTSPPTSTSGDQAGRGLHFVVFNPTSDDFHRNRLAMDGVLPDGTKLPFDPGPRAGIQLRAHDPHRQNFIVPPRRNRSFPLVEFLA